MLSVIEKYVKTVRVQINEANERLVTEWMFTGMVGGLRSDKYGLMRVDLELPSGILVCYQDTN